MVKNVLNKKCGVAAAAARTLLVAACALTLSALMAESHARDIGALGGGGGAEFRSTCRPGDVMIGFNMRSGSALDAVVPICIGLNPQKTEWMGQAYQASAGLHGGGAGSFQKIDCRPGYAVRHLHVFMDGNRMVNHIRMTCADLDSNPGDWHDSVPGQIGGQAIGDVRFNCGDHEWGTGIFGRSGALVDQLGLQCEILWPHCETYASRAAEQAAKGIRECNFSGDRWHPSKSFHFAWCVGLRGDQGPPNAETAARDQALQQCAAPPPTPDAQPQTCAVTRDTDVFDAPDGNGQKTGVLADGTQGVTLVVPCRDNWCHVKWPAGQGWVYTGPDFPSLNCP